MAPFIAKAIVAAVELVALVTVGIAFLILPDTANTFLAVFAVPLVFLFVYTLVDALLR